MSHYFEVTIYKVEKQYIPRVLRLSESIITEINHGSRVIISHQILQKIDNEEELCWQLTWANKEAIQYHSEHWFDLPSSNELMSLVKEKIYMGYFLKSS